MLRILSVLNWVQAALLVVVGVWFALMTMTVGTHPYGIVVLLLCLAVAWPFAYLAAVIEKGRGRGLQTALAVLALAAFPLGTLFGAFTLYAVWVSDARTRFGAGAADEPLDEPPDEALPDAGRPGGPGDDGFDDAWPEGESPYAYAHRMVDAGLRGSALRARLEERGLAPDEVELLLRAVGQAGGGA